MEVTTLVRYSPEETVRLVAVTTEPQTLPANSTWYLMTNLPAPGYRQAKRSPFETADLSDVVRIYGLRQWVEQSFRQIKGELGFADFQVRSDRAIRRHWELVFCAFSFCWWAYTHKQEAPVHGSATTDPTRCEGGGEKKKRTADSSILAGGTAASARLAGPLGDALALLASVVESAPATTTASAA